ncbi:VOC family protein [Duganella fentianensis]|uniref:VOC family protein n=1 Tax=Duganella fentianensis TaxID=2692177 RepID=UPI0032B2B4D0
MDQPKLHSVTPHLVCEGAAAALEFYCKAFDAREIMRLPGKEGRLMHASIQIGDSVVMLADDFPEYGGLGPKALKGSPVTLHLNVADVDAAYAQALAAGAQSRMAPADMFWGDRYAQVTDPFGHYWSLATHIRDVTPEEMQAAMQQAMPPCE